MDLMEKNNPDNKEVSDIPSQLILGGDGLHILLSGMTTVIILSHPLDSSIPLPTSFKDEELDFIRSEVAG